MRRGPLTYWPLYRIRPISRWVAIARMRTGATGPFFESCLRNAGPRFIESGPRIRESWILRHAFIREAHQKRDQVGAIARRHREAVNQFVLERILAPSAASGCVVIDHFLERRD